VFAPIYITNSSINSLLVVLMLDKKLFDSFWIFSKTCKSCEEIAVSKLSLVYIVWLNFPFKKFAFSSAIKQTLHIFWLLKSYDIIDSSLFAFVCILSVNKTLFYRWKNVVCKRKIRSFDFCQFSLEFSRL